MDKKDIYKERNEKQNKRIEELRKEGKLKEYNVSESILFNSYCNGETAIFSNMYPSPLRHLCPDGVVRTFNGIDACFDYLMFYHVPKIREEMLKKNGVRACFECSTLRSKSYKYIPKEFNDTKYCWNLLYTLMKEKAEGSKDFYNALINSKGKYLVEHSFWDCSLEAGCVVRGDKAYGENYCGIAMMYLRDKLLKELEAKEASNSKEQKITFKEEVKETISAE